MPGKLLSRGKNVKAAYVYVVQVYDETGYPGAPFDGPWMV